MVVVDHLVSTIIPVYNRPAQLREAVTSVLSQCYRPIEVLIVDDGSTNGTTLRVAKEIAAENPGVVRVFAETNGGPGVARERGCQMAQGEFIQYLDSDDLLLPGKFSAQVKALRAQPTADVAYGITFFRDSSGCLNPEPHKDTGKQIATMFPRILNSRWWETATPLYRAEVCERAGAWTTLRLEEDWEYDCRVASLGGRLAWCPVPVSEHRDHGGVRLSRGTALDAVRLRQRAEAQQQIFGHAKAYGLTPDSPEMKMFSRSLFLLARQCGAARLPVQSRHLFDLARQAAGIKRARGVDFWLYALLATAVGWSATGAMSGWLDNRRRRNATTPKH